LTTHIPPQTLQSYNILRSKPHSFPEQEETVSLLSVTTIKMTDASTEPKLVKDETEVATKDEEKKEEAEPAVRATFSGRFLM
jgi:hypothetical protein